MNKTFLIIKREFLSRVKKKSFIIMTLIGPLLFAAMFVLPAALTQIPEGPKSIVVLDETGAIWAQTKSSDAYTSVLLQRNQMDLDNALDFMKTNDHDALLFIPAANDPKFIAQHCKLYGKDDVPLGLQNSIEKNLAKVLQEEMFKLQDIDPELVAHSRVSVNLKPVNISKSSESGEEVKSATGVKMAIGYISGFAIYMFVFIYGAQVMRGIIEEKTSRIVEVIISSVKPIQLMMGKIIGICGVAVLQYVFWIILSALIYFVASSFIFDQSLSPDSIAQANAMGADLSQGQEMMEMFLAVDFWLIIPVFAFYFIGGYLLYGSFFAIVGSAVDNEADTQQFMMPVVVPLLLALMVAFNTMENPNGDIAYWFSLFPLTSPIVMMIRLPFIGFGWDLILSMVILIASFIGSTWIAAKIYRVGILMYGKKVSFKELYKWLRYKN